MTIANKITINGSMYNLKVSTTSSGKQISTFGLSVYNGKDGNGKATREFINCKSFNPVQNVMGNIIVDGKLAFDVWNDKAGKKQVRPIIIVNSIEVDNGLSDSKKTQEPKAEEMPDSEIPF